MIKFIGFLIIIITYNSLTMAIEKKPYHHLPDGTFRNPESSPKRDENIKWSFFVISLRKRDMEKTNKKQSYLFSNIIELLGEKYKIFIFEFF